MGAASPRRRSAPALLAPRGPPPLPGLTGIPLTHSVFHGQAALVDLALTLVACGYARRHDWDPGHPAPGRMIERAVERKVGHLNRRTPEILVVVAFLRPWAEVLAEVGLEPEADERRWVLGLDCDQTYRLRVGRLVGVLGEPAAGVILNGFVRHTSLCTGDASDLEWIIDGWHGDGDPDEREETKLLQERAEAAEELGRRIDRLLHQGFAASPAVVPDARVRRQLAILAALAARRLPEDDTAWRETESVEWSLPRPAVHFVWDLGCPLDHALDEAEYLNAQDGSFPIPQHMWLLDPADPEGAARAWTRWIHSLHLSRATCRLIAALEALPGYSVSTP